MNQKLCFDTPSLKTYLNGLDIESDSISLPKREFRIGNLQQAYAAFYLVLSEYMEYKRLMYFSQKTEIIQNRISQYEQQYANLLRQQELVKEQMNLAQKQHHRDSLLQEKGVISSEEWEKSEGQYLQSRLGEENIHSSLQDMQILIAQMKESLLDIWYQDTDKLNTLRSQLFVSLEQMNAEIRAWELNYVLIAPVNGIITFTDYWSAHQNVEFGVEVFTVIPEMIEGNMDIIGKASLPVTRSGKVKAGQKVNIRLENFPDTEYGMLRGIVKSISLVPSRSGETLNYAVEIVLPNGLTTTYQKHLPYLPNMTGQAGIITEDISLLERFLMPIRKLLTEGLLPD